MKVHFLGIGGSGASAAAAIAKAQGFEVTGCDLEPHNEFTINLDQDKLYQGHDPKHLFCHSERLAKNLPRSGKIATSVVPLLPRNDKLIDILAVTPAIYSLDPDNPELLEAKVKNIPILTWQEFTGEYLTKGKFVIAICGTHGKTTTTAMIAKLLTDANLSPTVLLGAIMPEWKTNYRIGKGRYFVVEADEFNDNFLSYKPDINVVTNIEMDHPEYFKDINAVLDSFEKFLLQTKGTIVANLSDTNISEIVKDVMKQSSVLSFDYSKNDYNLSLQIPGEFNQLNAAAAFQVGLLLNIDPNIIRKSLESFKGAGRRFEYIGEYQGAKVYSDFGHHPTEIKVTVEATKQKFPDQRLLLIYQPHMFSRTKALFNDFVKVFQNVPADKHSLKSSPCSDFKTFIMDIYPSREIDTGIVTSKQLVDAIHKESVQYIGSVEQTLEKLKPEIKKGDVVLFMSAGDTDKLARELVG